MHHPAIGMILHRGRLVDKPLSFSRIALPFHEEKVSGLHLLDFGHILDDASVVALVIFSCT